MKVQYAMSAPTKSGLCVGVRVESGLAVQFHDFWIPESVFLRPDFTSEYSRWASRYLRERWDQGADNPLF